MYDVATEGIVPWFLDYLHTQCSINKTIAGQTVEIGAYICPPETILDILGWTMVRLIHFNFLIK